MLPLLELGLVLLELLLGVALLEVLLGLVELGEEEAVSLELGVVLLELELLGEVAEAPAPVLLLMLPLLELGLVLLELLGLVLLVELVAEVSLCGVVLLPVVLLEDGGAPPELFEHVAETILALVTLNEPSLPGVPVTETVWPTWSLNAALLLDCNCQVLPLESVKVTLSPEPPMHPCIVVAPADEELPVALWLEVDEEPDGFV